MPRAVQGPEETDLIRNKILDVAVALIIEEGFNRLSMRKIASRLGITATNIYYYFSSKDEINLMVKVRGFCMLHDKLLAAYNKYHSPSDQLRATTWDYVNFGIDYPDYYYVMYNLRIPKHIDCRGTKFEVAANDGTLRAASTHRITVDILARMMGKKIENQEEYLELKYKAIQLWSDSHGIVSLYNSRVLYGTAKNDKEILERRINDLIDGTIASCTAESA